MGIGITPNGSKTCWSRRRSVAIASLPEKRDNQQCFYSHFQIRRHSG